MTIDLREHDSAEHHPRVLADGSYRVELHELGTLRTRLFQRELASVPSADGVTALSVRGE